MLPNGQTSHAKKYSRRFLVAIVEAIYLVSLLMFHSIRVSGGNSSFQGLQTIMIGFPLVILGLVSLGGLSRYTKSGDTASKKVFVVAMAVSSTMGPFAIGMITG